VLRNKTTGAVERRLEIDKRIEVEGSSGLGDFARLDASCANFHPARATLRLLHANRL
jgi:hypothetical protein